MYEAHQSNRTPNALFGRSYLFRRLHLSQTRMHELDDTACI
jgi:hypothetical protein